MTDKYIKDFLQSGKVPPPENDKFIEDVIRQLDLLPQPASDPGNSQEDGDIRVRLEKLDAARKALSRRIRISAFSLGIISVSSASLLVMSVLMFFFL